MKYLIQRKRLLVSCRQCVLQLFDHCTKSPKVLCALLISPLAVEPNAGIMNRFRVEPESERLEEIDAKKSASQVTHLDWRQEFLDVNTPQIVRQRAHTELTSRSFQKTHYLKAPMLLIRPPQLQVTRATLEGNQERRYADSLCIPLRRKSEGL